MRRRNRRRNKTSVLDRIKAKLPQKKGLNFRRKRKKVESKKVLHVGLWIVEIAAVVAVAYFLNIGFFTQVVCSGESMESTIPENATTWVNRVCYYFKDPEVDDVIAFTSQGLANNGYSIKRIVAVPGDTVQITNGKLYVNGERVTLHNSDLTIADAGIASEEITLGEDEYFVLGDSVNNSEDSRYVSVGNVKRDEIYGKVWFIISLSGIGIVN